mmetsp:Transcript_84441/g.168626  ORF Transcript_84441/g.168626 Transcript_84441/m.168626 type:complete len:391 (-) Transcript_84441:1150-2322(-)
MVASRALQPEVPRALATAVLKYPVAQGPVIAENAACVVDLFAVSITSWGQVLSAEYVPPVACPPPWSSVVLNVDGTIDAVQYDRYGAMWLNGVELLRTTTPEPNGKGKAPIRWQIRRQLTHYSPVFRKASKATLTIPNTVDSSYTGILNITARLRFLSRPMGYVLPAASLFSIPSGTPPDAVQPLLFSGTMGTDVWGMMSASGLGNISVSVRVPSRNAVRALLDVYASAHGCEEFFYSNLPESVIRRLNASKACGGGTYRAVEVIVDGLFAGAALPFPTVYSGGIVPNLWKPIAGIHSFVRATPSCHRLRPSPPVQPWSHPLLPPLPPPRRISLPSSSTSPRSCLSSTTAPATLSPSAWCTTTTMVSGTWILCYACGTTRPTLRLSPAEW